MRHVICDTGLIATVDEGSDGLSNHRCLMVSRTDGTCRSFMSADQVSFVGKSVCLDAVYDNLWRSVSCTLHHVVFITCFALYTSQISTVMCLFYKITDKIPSNGQIVSWPCGLEDA